MYESIDDIFTEIDEEEIEKKRSKDGRSMQEKWQDTAKVLGLPDEWVKLVCEIQRRIAIHKPWHHLHTKQKEIEVQYGIEDAEYLKSLKPEDTLKPS